MAKKADPFIKWLQSRLASHGYSTGLIDGIMGPVTQRALVAFQGAQGLNVTGVADELTVAALRSTTVGIHPRPIGQELQLPPAQATKWPTQAQVPTFYGERGANQTSIALPYAMRLAWDKGTIVRRMTLHKKVAPSALKALQEVASVYSEEERRALGLDLFGGSLNVRKMRGGNSWSMHSWGIAIDFDPERNSLNTRAPQARLSHTDAVPFWLAWERQGWLSLGRARGYDWMHVQAARL